MLRAHKASSTERRIERMKVQFRHFLIELSWQEETLVLYSLLSFQYLYNYAASAP